MGRVLVTGAAGELGSQVVKRLLSHGREVTAFVADGQTVDVPDGVDPNAIDVIAGDVRRRVDVDTAVGQADAVVHLATSPIHRSVDIAGTTNVAYACTESETPLVYVSVVGADRSRFPYYRTKAKMERMLGDVPGLAYTLQRATQFHSTIDAFLSKPIIPLPGDAAFQPLDPADLASRLVGLVAAGPSGRVEDFAGPTVLTVDDLIEIRQEVLGSVGRLLPLPKFSVLREAVDGAFISAEADTGFGTYRDWLSRSNGCR